MESLMTMLDEKFVIPKAQVDGAKMRKDSSFWDEFSSTDEEDEENENYEQEFVMEEMKKYAKCSKKTEDNGSGMGEVEGVDGMEYKNNPLSVYSTYNFTSNFVKKELPIDSFRETIVHLIEVNNVVIIQGPTGCGKTTQVPQFILDNCKEKREYCNIAITQPRKIATLNVSKRVCEERGWTLGTVCGYQVGLEKKISNDTILTFMTTGVLLQKIICAKSLQHFTHIVIDEIHERNQDLDFLLLIVRRFLFTNSPKTKVILMSATIEAEEFANYFRTQNMNISIPAPIIYVDKKSDFKKHYFYLEHLKPALDSTRVGNLSFEIDKPGISDGIWRVFTFLIKIIDKLDSVDPITNEKVIGSVLVFLPGINEIEEAHQRLDDHYKETRSEGSAIKWDIIPVHSSLPNDEQARVFKRAKPGIRKVILSTNIAESSITVPDSYYVIDFCQTKVMTVDPITKYMSLKLEWASHVNCEQRAGRVGRIGSGRVYRLVPYDFYLKTMPRKSVPEMIRAPLERVVLQAKMLNFTDSPKQILALAMNPPNLKNIATTILALKEIGGILQTCRGTITPCDGDITFIGKVMAALPIDVHLSKLIVLGYLFSCLRESIIMAAGCSIPNIFSIPFRNKLDAYKKLFLWADGSFSDLIALLNLFQVWQACKRDNQFENAHQEHRWCTMNLVSLKGLREWNLLVTEIQQRLEYMNIKSIPGQTQLRQDEKPLVLKVITAGAFYPNYFYYDPAAIVTNERDAVKTVGGRNPYRTIWLGGMDSAQPGPLYIRPIKDLIDPEKRCEPGIVIGFDGSSKIYVEFKNRDVREQVTLSVNGREMITDAIPGRIPKEVYEVIRKRQLKYPFKIKLLGLKEAWKYAEANGISQNSTLQQLAASAKRLPTTKSCSEDDFSSIPTLDTEWITIKISEFIDAGHFWVNTMESDVHLAKIETVLNRTVLHPAIASGDTIRAGKIYAARYNEDNIFYRCKLIAYGPVYHQIIFIDYGNLQHVKSEDLYNLPKVPGINIAPLAVECVLQGVQPSRKMNPKCVWSDKVNQYWRRQLLGLLLYGRVYSVVDDIVHLELYKHEPRNKQSNSVNQQMLDLHHAEPAVESFFSKANHEKREEVGKSENPNLEAARLSSYDAVVRYEDFEPPEFRGNCRTINLKGPYSPLEIKLFGCTNNASEKRIEIEGNSVNTVLLDNDLQDMHTRFLVAGSVNQTILGDQLRLRETTLMPNIPGLPMLLILLFCPTMEVKLTDDGTRIAAILAGLGYNKFTKKSFYPSHDLFLTLDTELTVEEIKKINKIRFYMNQGVRLMSDISKNIASHEDIVVTQDYLKRDLLELIYADRKSVKKIAASHCNLWGKTDPNIVILKPNMDNESEDIWPFLWFVKLRRSKKYPPTISQNLEDLDLIAHRVLPEQAIDCQMCGVLLEDIDRLRLHLISPGHKEKFKQYQEDILVSDEEEEDN